jgi:hypothetical protein
MAVIAFKLISAATKRLRYTRKTSTHDLEFKNLSKPNSSIEECLRMDCYRESAKRAVSIQLDCFVVPQGRTLRNDRIRSHIAGRYLVQVTSKLGPCIEKSKAFSCRIVPCRPVPLSPDMTSNS